MVQLVSERPRPGLGSSPTEKSSSGTPAKFAPEEALLEARPGTASVKQVCLHDTRMKDELEEYRERIANSK